LLTKFYINAFIFYAIACLRWYRYTHPHEENLHSEFHSESTTKKPNIQNQNFGKVSGGPEDPNVWKPKHASKTKEEKENPDKASTEVIKSTGFT
jgi:hypothetical protein